MQGQERYAGVAKHAELTGGMKSHADGLTVMSPWPAPYSLQQPVLFRSLRLS